MPPVPSEAAVLGVLSLILWSLILVVTIKYVIILVRADNNGEGGTLALMALAQRALGGLSATVLLLGIVAAALFYGNAVITPALSVLSAVEGLEIVAPQLEPFVTPISIVILLGLFLAQSRGTARMGGLLRPDHGVLVLASLAFFGVIHIWLNPSVLAGVNPIYGISFLASHGMIGLLTLAAVFLAVTGAEALYADLGHFGRRPIRLAWLFVVLPSLILNYFGQGALVLRDPTAIDNPFLLDVPGVGRGCRWSSWQPRQPSSPARR